MVSISQRIFEKPLSYFNLVECIQTVVPCWHQMWKHAVQESDKPVHCETGENKCQGNKQIIHNWSSK